MSTAPVLRSWVVVMGAAVATRLWWFAVKAGFHYPDEIFQYLEPGHLRMTGDAFLAWEYEAGARHWLVPAFWASWLEIGRALGLRRWDLYRWVTLHAALLSALVVPGVLRLVRAALGLRGESTAWLAAWTAALLPALGFFAPHTMSELPTMLFVVWAFALLLELDDIHGARTVHRHALAVGALLALATACRVPSVLFVAVVVADLALRRRLEALFFVGVGFALAAGALALIDIMTWGAPFHSAIAFVRANMRHERHLASAGEAQPWHYYASDTARWLGPAAAFAGALAALSSRRHPRLLLAWALPVAALSVLRHKQDRFILPAIPLFIASVACGADALLRWVPRARRSVASLIIIVAVCASSLVAVARRPLRSFSGVLRAQAWIGTQSDATGVLFDGGENANGGYLLLDRSIPQAPLSAVIVEHELFNYVIAVKPGPLATMRANPNFAPIAEFDDAVVFRRR